MQYELTRCLVCGTADTDEIAGPEDIRREAELLWAFHMRRLSPLTPGDRLVDRVAFSQRPPWRVVRCHSCGLVYRNPVERSSEVHDTYTDESTAREALRALHDSQLPKARKQVERLTRIWGRAGAGVEVGSYAGSFLAAARERDWQFEGVDLNTHANDFVRSLGLTARDGDLASLNAHAPVDVIAIWNTFDQLPDPRSTLRAAWRILRERGVLAIRVPNGDCYARWRLRLDDGPVARAIATEVLAQNNLLTFPYRNGFSFTSLTKLLEEVGFEVEHSIKDSLVRTADAWTRPWARFEERLWKAATKRIGAWIEIYARKQRR